jgi:2-polyprenyl-3-methyl-5-hydroxy-6-metoxy-1,4-benzoquinol methylase
MEKKSHQEQIRSGQRFEFGENWTRFLGVLDDERIAEARKSLVAMLGTESLDGISFLDIGSGSGLFSLAALSLGAKVTSFDFDPKSVACARELKRRYFPDDPDWTILEGSVLDRNFLASLGQHDLVYSWGVLHHTGSMWAALENVAPSVAPGGRLFIAIYNDQGRASRVWTAVKRLYCSGLVGRLLVQAIYIPYFFLPAFGWDLLKLRNPFRRYTEYKRQRGMSKVHDWYDWLGGYPFEVAKPEEIFDFYRKKGFELRRLISCAGGLGCNQFVFELPRDARRH